MMCSLLRGRAALSCDTLVARAQKTLGLPENGASNQGRQHGLARLARRNVVQQYGLANSFVCFLSLLNKAFPLAVAAVYLVLTRNIDDVLSSVAAVSDDFAIIEAGRARVGFPTRQALTAVQALFVLVGAGFLRIHRRHPPVGNGDRDNDPGLYDPALSNVLDVIDTTGLISGVESPILVKGIGAVVVLDIVENAA